MIAQYQAIVPDAGERFFGYMEREQAQRHDIQRRTLAQVTAVQRFTFVLSWSALVIAGICALAGRAEGLAIGAAALVPLIGGAWQRHKENKQEREQQKQVDEHDDGE